MDFNIKILYEQAATVKLPGTMQGIHSCSEKIVFAHLNHNLERDKAISLTASCTPEVLIKKKNIYFPEVKSITDLQILIQNIDKLIICDGVDDDGKKSSDCNAYVNEDILISVKRTLNSKKKIQMQTMY